MFCDLLKKMREDKKISRQVLADELKISKRTLESYEYGQREPNIEMIIKLADFYGVTTDYLLGRDETPPRIVDENRLKALEKILIKEYLELTDEQRENVLDFFRNAIREEEERQANRYIERTLGDIEDETAAREKKGAI